MAKNATTPETKKFSATEKKALFETYKKADDTFTKAKASLEAAGEARSKTVKAIHDALGIGPFNYKARILTVVKRVQKVDGEPTGKETYYFKSPSSQEVQDIG